MDAMQEVNKQGSVPKGTGPFLCPRITATGLRGNLANGGILLGNKTVTTAKG
jgi:hypothetical protein